MIIYITILGCDFPNNERVKKEFLTKHPTYIVLEIGPGEGDSDNVYFHIKYKKNKKGETFKIVWLYQRQSNGKWKVTNIIK